MADFQPYVDDSLIGSGHMHSATIVNRSNGEYWAYNGEYVPQPEEISHIINVLKDPAKAQAEGIKIAGQKHFVIRATEDLLYTKVGAMGACIATSNQAIIIGVYGEETNPANCNMVVENIAKYLRDNQY